MKLKSLFRVSFVVLSLLAVSVSAQEVSTLSLTGFPGCGGLTVGPDGKVYCANFGDNVGVPNGTNAYRIESDGTPVEFATGFLGASGNEFDTHGNYFQSSIAGHRINKVDTLGVNTVFADAADGLVQPVGIVFNSAGDLFVCSFGTNQVLKFDTAGNGSVFADNSTGLLTRPSGIAIDDDENLYVINWGGGAVIKILPDGTPSLLANLSGLNGTHITFTRDHLFAVCRDSRQVYQITLDGVVTVLAGTGECGRTSGPASSARFSWPNGIEANAAGDTLFVNQSKRYCPYDTINPTIVRIITGFLPTTGLVDARPEVTESWLLRSEPNPFREATRIEFALPGEMSASELAIFSVGGRQVRQWDLGENRTGVVFWDGNNSAGLRVAAGTYFYQLRSHSGDSRKGKVVYIR